MLLGSYDHARSHESHISNDFVGREAMLVDEVCADETPSSAKASLAMNRNSLLLDSDHLVCQIDELANQTQWGTCAVVEDHIKVFYPHCGKV